MYTWQVGWPDKSKATKIRIDPIDLAKQFSSLNGTQVTVSENHPAWRKRGKTRPSRFVDMGGEFLMQKKYCRSPVGKPFRLFGLEVRDPFTGAVTVADYTGPLLPIAPDLMTFPAFANSSNSELDVLGTKAIARCSPANPTADLSTFLGELYSDGLPKVTGAFLKELRGLHPKQVSKRLAEEHLNYQFGWLPFVSDIKNIVHSIDHAHEILSQYDRDSGRLVRRTYGFPPVETVTTTLVLDKTDPWINPYSNTLTNDLINATGKVFRTDKVTKTQWFSGGFTYYIPPETHDGVVTSDDIARKVIQAKKLLGFTVTPKAMWNISPWSWCVDWFVNVGDVHQNISNLMIDNQVLVYGYIMEHTVSERTYTFSGDTRFHSGNAYPPAITLVSETKLRRKATPYGFGISWDGLSALQKSILAAIGLTRWRGK